MKRRVILGLALLPLLTAHAQEASAPVDADVVFVCQHGSAKSVIAAAHFNRLAAARGSKLRAVSRGMTPDASLQEATRAGLQRDGLLPASYAAASLSEAQVKRTRRLVTIGLEGEPDYVRQATRLQWNDVPPVSKNYDAARDAMVQKIEALLAEMEPAR